MAVPSPFVHADLSIYVNTQGQLKVASQPMDCGKVDNLDRAHRMCDRLECAVIQQHWLSLYLDEEKKAMIWNRRNDLGLLFLWVSSDSDSGFLLFQTISGTWCWV